MKCLCISRMPSFFANRLKGHIHIHIIQFLNIITEKSFDTWPKDNGVAFFSESFAFNFYISTQLTNT